VRTRETLDGGYVQVAAIDRDAVLEAAVGPQVGVEEVVEDRCHGSHAGFQVEVVVMGMPDENNT